MGGADVPDALAGSVGVGVAAAEVDDALAALKSNLWGLFFGYCHKPQFAVELPRGNRSAARPHLIDSRLFRALGQTNRG